MALGSVSNSVDTSGALKGSNSAALARQVILLGVSPLGTPLTRYSPQSVAGMKAALGAVGPLAEVGSMIFDAPGAPPPIFMPLTPSAVGAVSAAVTQVGLGTGTVAVSIAPHVVIDILCTTSGAIGTMKVRFRLGGSANAYGPVTNSADTGGGTWVYRVPGTFTTLTFNIADYVATKTNNIAVDGTVTPGAAWVGVVTQASSPTDSYSVVATVAKGGALGIATLSISLDAGLGSLPTMMIPVSGVVVIPGTGLVLTCALAFTAGDTYSFLAIPPGYSTSDISAAFTAIAALSPAAPTAATIYFPGLPASAAGAISAASTIQTALDSAFALGFNWLAICECPSSIAGDAVVSAGAAIVDTADTDAVIRAARVGSTFSRVSVFVGTNPTPTPLSGRSNARGSGLPIAYLAAASDPGDGVATRNVPLKIASISRDERVAATSLHDAQYNVLQSVNGSVGAYLAIEAGGVGWRNMTADATMQDADGVRALNVMVAALGPVCNALVGQRPPVNLNGTIEERTRLAWTDLLDGTVKRSLGLQSGGAFAKPQASAASAVVLASSQLGVAPKRLDVEYTMQPKGMVTAVSNVIHFYGAK